MRRKDDTGVGDFEDAFSPVPHASGFRTILSLATQHHMLCDHVDISQAFVQGDLLPGDGHNPQTNRQLGNDAGSTDTDNHLMPLVLKLHAPTIYPHLKSSMEHIPQMLPMPPPKDR